MPKNSLGKLTHTNSIQNKKKHGWTNFKCHLSKIMPGLLFLMFSMWSACHWWDKLPSIKKKKNPAIHSLYLCSGVYFPVIVTESKSWLIFSFLLSEMKHPVCQLFLNVFRFKSEICLVLNLLTVETFSPDGSRNLFFDTLKYRGSSCRWDWTSLITTWTYNLRKKHLSGGELPLETFTATHKFAL